MTLLGGREVRKVPLLAALEAHEVVHFAGHSHYDATTPSKSGWLLHEGLLSAGEISKLSRPPSLVFSNSCQAGTTAQWTSGYRYEGQAFGIGSAFLLAGVQHYIGTFWVVHDEESVGFATAFYHNVVLGRSVGAALLEARHGIIAQKEWQSLTWASYMLYGDPTFTLLPKTTRELEALLPPPHQIEQQQQHPSPPPLHSRRKGDRWLARLRFWRKTFFILAMVVVVCVAFVFIPPRYESPETPTGPSKKERAALQPRAPGKPAPVSRQSARASQKQRQPKAIGVMTFKALRVDPHFEWMRDAIRDHFNSQLTKGADLQVYSKEHLDFLVQKEATTEIEVANQLGIAKMISGSFLVVADKLRIEAHVVNVENGMFEASDSIEGPVDQFFDLQRQLALKVMDQLHITLAIEDGDGTAEATVPSLKAYKMLLEAEGETGGTAPATPNTPEGEDPAGTKEETLSFLFPGVSKLNVAWAQELPSRPTTKRVPEEEIRQVVESYRQAYENKDLKLLDAVYLTLTPAQREANLRYFQNTQDLKVTISDVHIDVRGNEAAVSYTREDRFVDVDTGQSIKLETRLTKIFSRTDAGWKLVAGKQGTPAATPK
ncbi:MAG: CHAT domain-containing protein [Deltaproteobacteria bacterium]|nr:CHAT domain-containing protein [Deltaproteobacteria bacterium]